MHTKINSTFIKNIQQILHLIRKKQFFGQGTIGKYIEGCTGWLEHT